MTIHRAFERLDKIIAEIVPSDWPCLEQLKALFTSAKDANPENQFYPVERQTRIDHLSL